MLKKAKKFILYSCFFTIFLSFQTSFGKESSLDDFPQLYHTAEEGRLRQSFEKAIIEAKKSILIFTFSFSDLNFIELVNQKAEEGIDVVIIIDKDHRELLLKYGNDKFKIVTRNIGEGRVHHKILVVDEKNVWLGSANFSTAAFSSQENFVVGFKSIAFAKALHYEADVFQGYQNRQEEPTVVETFGDQKISLFLLPHSDPYYNNIEKKINEKGKKQLLSLIRNATNSIKIAMMVWTDPELEKAVLDAHRRGVLVEVLLQDMLDVVAWNLKKEGIFVMANPNINFMHNKWMWIDEMILVNGSANWSRSSFSRNDESFIVIENLTEEQKSYLKNYWAYLTKK